MQRHHNGNGGEPPPQQMSSFSNNNNNGSNGHHSSDGDQVALVALDQVQSKSVERLIYPIIEYATRLVEEGADQLGDPRGRSGDELVSHVSSTIEHFMKRGKAVAEKALSAGSVPLDEQSRQVVEDALRQLGEGGAAARRAGLAFVRSPHAASTKAEMRDSTRQLLKLLAHFLCIVDSIEIRRCQDAIQMVREALDRLLAARNPQDTERAYGALQSSIDAVRRLVGARVLEMRSREAADELLAARAQLVALAPVLHTATLVHIAEPSNAAAQRNRHWAHAELVDSLERMHALLEHGDETVQQLTAIANQGEGAATLSMDIDEFQHRVYMEPHAYSRQRDRPEIESRLENIIRKSARIADAEHTRQERRNRIVDEGNALRSAVQELLREYESPRRGAENAENIDLAMVLVGQKIKDDRRHLRRAVVDAVSDAFLDTRVPLLLLVDAAERGLQGEPLETAASNFLQHAATLSRVSRLVCEMCSDVEAIRVIRATAASLDRLAPEVVSAARLLAAQPESSERQQNMKEFREAWLNKVGLLTIAVDACTQLDDFLAVSEAHLLEDTQSAVQALYPNEALPPGAGGQLLDRTAGAIRGRGLRVCEVVERELDALQPGVYSDRIRQATIRLKEHALPDFSARAAKIVDALYDQPPNAGPPSAEWQNATSDELIDACNLVFSAVKDVRNALVMNRCPEDVDSDNEYEEDGITLAGHGRDAHNTSAAASAVSEENQQRVIRRLPDEHKKKIQQQIDVFKLTANKFEREVAQWDETGNDIIVLAKHMCMIMLNMTDFTRGRGPLKTTVHVIDAAKAISEAGEKLRTLSIKIADESVESSTRKDLEAYLAKIPTFCVQLNVLAKVKMDVQQIGEEVQVSGLDSAITLIGTARNLLNTVVQTVKTAYIASTKFRKLKSGANVVEWRMARPEKVNLVRPGDPVHGSGPSGSTGNRERVVRRASERRPMAPLKQLAQFHVAGSSPGNGTTNHHGGGGHDED